MFGPDSNEKPREYKRRRKIIETAELPIASAEVRDNTYSNLLSLLTLCPTHQASLKERGLTRDEIDWLGYRTTPTTRLRRIVTELLERGCVLDGVPGFYCQKDTGQWTLDIRGSGIMLPDRNLNGQIEAIQVRLDKVYNQKFYNLTSIDQYYGTQSKCCPHYVGVHEGDEVVCLTEGVMKADIAYSFALGTSYESGFVGLTGVPSYSQFERALEELMILVCGRRRSSKMPSGICKRSRKFLSIRSILVGLCPESTEASCASGGQRLQLKRPKRMGYP